ncbi:hypothetical protein EUGRSUZ_I01330 [Eucalyptus grandis]|uniref:Uncharacterized protein n=2 Tax=Eucalyptus grandis TaxID=71139 RepID=A0ACC3JFK3_EUCGR|nr:hypothetical protein EUGRSUZ_I01330 [Eucalyptus grandis]
MSLKGRGQGVDLGTSTLSLMRSIFFSFFGRAFPYDPLNLFPFFVRLSPLPHRTGSGGAAPAADGDAGGSEAADDDSVEIGEVRGGRLAIATAAARLAAAPNICIIAILPRPRGQHSTCTPP